MIVKKSELRSVERLLERIDVEGRKDLRVRKMTAEFESLSEIKNLTAPENERMKWLRDKIRHLDLLPPVIQEPVFFAKRPHLLMPLGFDEFRVIPVEDGVPAVRFAEIPGFDGLDFAFPYEVIFRESHSGTWFQFEGLGRHIWGPSPDKKTLHFLGPREAEKFFESAEYVRTLERACQTPDANPHTLLFPGIWSPSSQATQRVELANAVPGILKAIADEKVRLRDIPWRRLEEIVAELLRAYGMEVWVTPSTHDGGRDVIARGELIPGEPAVLPLRLNRNPWSGSQMSSVRFMLIGTSLRC
jgi:hypothetical protein